MRYGKKQESAGQAGVATLELALVIPVLMLLAFAGYEATNYTLTQQRLDRSAYLVANIITQYVPADGSQYDNQLTADVFRSTIFPQFSQAVTASNNGNSPDASVIATGIRKEGTEYRIKWQIAGGGTLNDSVTSSQVDGLKPGAVSSAVRDQPASFDAETLNTLSTAKDHEAFVVVEAFYHYRPALGSVLAALPIPPNFVEQTLQRRMYVVSRNGAQICLPNDFQYSECDGSSNTVAVAPTSTVTPTGYFDPPPGVTGCPDSTVMKSDGSCVTPDKVTGVITAGDLGTGVVLPPGSSGGASGGDAALGGGDQGGCFTAEVLITMADGSKKPIGELQAGDEVQGQTRTNRVIDPEMHRSDEVLYGFNGETAFVSSGHQLRTTRGWSSIDPEETYRETKHESHPKKLKVGDRLMLEDGTTWKIHSIDPHSSGGVQSALYNPRLDGNHTYYANGILAHNMRMEAK